ncbi:hypothetical protein [Microbacterium rhizomatis]|nr:hypothetical protein [Microbacterium rhizomatis]
MSLSIPEPDPYEAQTGFDDEDWEYEDVDATTFEAGEDELDIEEGRAHER